MPAAPDDRPFSGDELSGLFAAAGRHARVVLAVSGGSDSLALMALFEAWRRVNPAAPEALVVTIDHGLRTGSADDARFVVAEAARLGLPTEVRRWDGDKPASDLQAAARDARYRLLTETAVAEGAGAILTAHTLDDQAETVMLRLARGSGVKGLAAMSPVRRLGDVDLVRPLLSVSRERLRAALVRDGLGWCDDPSNDNARFARVRMRALMPALAKEGLTARRLAETADRLARADAALDAMVQRLAAAEVTADRFGVLRLGILGFAAAEQELRLRLLARMLGWAAGCAGDYGPRLDRLERAAARLAEGPDGRFTLSGALVTRRHGTIAIAREAGRSGLPEVAVDPGSTRVWDGRWRVRLTDAAPAAVQVRALGSAWRKLAPVDGGAEAAVLAVVPGLFAGESLVAAPAFGHFAGPAWREAVEAGFASEPPGGAADALTLSTG
ncbi:tRNA lysidine(34) synthetase TilS [Amorphus coralli]|uniref:tRNA lysidine(34) synthetase TilS n=1 Tax=Amorphus coralli TaxID=340680 RepID=UPI000366C1C6|nr:tRNA lysidine(34) synthetase TilS [Amorphus coralli]